MDYFLELNFQKLQQHGLDESIKVKDQGLIADWGLEKTRLHSAWSEQCTLCSVQWHFDAQYLHYIELHPCAVFGILYRAVNCALCSAYYTCAGDSAGARVVLAGASAGEKWQK